MKKTILALVFAAMLVRAGNACVSTSAGGTTSSTLASTWSSCGATFSIAFDNGSALNYAASGTSTTAFTVTGTNPYLIVFVSTGAADGDGLTGITYNGVAMTQLIKFHSVVWVYLYGLANPATGSHNIVISSSAQMVPAAASYTGVQQTNIQGATSSNTGTTLTPTITLTTTNDGAWLVGGFSSLSNVSAPSGTAKRANIPFSLGAILDTNGPKSPAGSYSLSGDNGGLVNCDEVGVELIPFAVTAGTTPQAADTAQIASHVNLTGDLSVVSIDVNGAAASLTTDGLAHTVTTTGGVTVTLGCTAVAGSCSSAYAIDTVAASTGNEVTWARTGIATGQYVISKNVVGSASINLARSIFQAGSGRAVRLAAGAGTDVLNVTNSKIVNGEQGIDINDGGTVTINLSNVSSTGMTTGPLVDFHSTAPTACTILNLTVTGATSNLPVLQASADWSACTITGVAVLADAGGVYSPGIIGANGTTSGNTATWSYNLGKSFHVGQEATVYGITGCTGDSGHHCLLQNNIVDGFSQDFAVGSYTDQSGNIAIGRANTGSEQGLYFGFGTTNITSTNDVAIATDASSSNFGLFYIGNGTTAGNVVITTATSIMSDTSTGGAAIDVGEGSGGSTLNVVTSSISNSITTGGLYGIASQNTDNTFVNTGTGSVGVWGNSVFGGVTSNYNKVGTSTNFDNGVTAHPSATYGDLTLNPKFVSTARRFSDCDAILGGPGTYANLFLQLFNRWNGTNGRYTAQNVYNCMRAPLAPREIRLAGKGAVTPVLIFTGMQ